MIITSPTHSAVRSTNVSQHQQNIRNRNSVSYYPALKPLKKDEVVFTGKVPKKTPKKAGELVQNAVDSFKGYIAQITENKNGLADNQVKSVRAELDETNRLMKELEEKRTNLGRVLDYDNMRKAGVGKKKIKRYVKEDNEAIGKAEKFTVKNLELREHMFGYPANMSADSATTKHLRRMETELPLLNNCGDPYQGGNYAMDAKEYEKPILNKLYKHFGIDSKKGWGYITTGGSESNKWGIYNGFAKYPNGRLYYSESAHYSIDKSVNRNIDANGDSIPLVKSTVIKQKNTESEAIDANALIKEAKKNWKENKEPAIVMLTWGTTKTGAMDDAAKISKALTKAEVPHYIHLDAAMYGGISKNQKGAPAVPDVEKLGVDSIAVSMHKYFGSNDVKSVVLTKEKPIHGKAIDYISQIDNTTAGSRTFSPFSTMQRVTENLERSLPDDYIKNINKFDELLTENKVEFHREPKSNTYVINQPSEEICKKYQLSTFKDKDKNEKAHIIIFPYHKEKVMREFAKDLANDLNKTSKK